MSGDGDGLCLAVTPSALGQTSSTGYAAPWMKARRVLGESIELENVSRRTKKLSISFFGSRLAISTEVA
jgi:hypothetical protein